MSDRPLAVDVFGLDHHSAVGSWTIMGPDDSILISLMRALVGGNRSIKNKIRLPNTVAVMAVLSP